MRIACRTHHGRGRDGADCVIPVAIGPAFISARPLDADAVPESPPGYAELDEETLTALRLFAAEDMLARTR